MTDPHAKAAGRDDSAALDPDAAAAEARLFSRLDHLGIVFRLYRHPPVGTVDEAQARRGEIPGGHNKCLFLKDKAGNRILAVVDEQRRVDLGALTRFLRLKRLSFGSPDRLRETLAVQPGSVTPFALINATPARADAAASDPTSGPSLSHVLLDAAMLENDPLNYHPLHNAATVAISPQDLLAFVRACGFMPRIVDFETMTERPVASSPPH